jgi:hypothetical protein
MTALHALAFVPLLCWIFAEPLQMSFTSIDQRNQSQIDEPREAAVRSAAELAALWKEHEPNNSPPAVDFGKSMVIAVFLGTRRTAGYTAEITKIEKQDDGLLVTWREQRPGPDDLVAQVVTAPFHIVRTALHSGPVRFQRSPDEPRRKRQSH